MTPRERTASLAPLRMLRTCRFRYGFPDYRVNLAIAQNSLGRFSARTTRRCSTAFRRLLRFNALAVCNRLVSGTLHLPLGVLFSFRSRYYCAIGLGSYLGFEVNAPGLRARFPTHATPGLPHSPSSFPLRDYHPLWYLVPEDFGLRRSGIKGPKVLHISPHSSRGDSDCPIPCSLAVTSGISIDFSSSAY